MHLGAAPSCPRPSAHCIEPHDTDIDMSNAIIRPVLCAKNTGVVTQAIGTVRSSPRTPRPEATSTSSTQETRSTIFPSEGFVKLAAVSASTPSYNSYKLVPSHSGSHLLPEVIAIVAGVVCFLSIIALGIILFVRRRRLRRLRLESTVRVPELQKGNGHAQCPSRGGIEDVTFNRRLEETFDLEQMKFAKREDVQSAESGFTSNTTMPISEESTTSSFFASVNTGPALPLLVVCCNPPPRAYIPPPRAYIPPGMISEEERAAANYEGGILKLYGE
ncbi:hypothetical protein CYLTODRAFT_494247 [Cylindrobasidium torrendii FP15055 ss-10]|uniref:Uncharacterized protein n=1 Tax=Cylindrobasidium torrendii FP15055 ss-10 TaxID=1314674 RepID=A0A0D7AXP9_9AGAR|nr:hypothetical protein CYLTODRAFT_494247 [Cylindrobasidium torrendii FP15055 ss-10]